MDGAGKIYVADRFNDRIQAFGALLSTTPDSDQDGIPNFSDLDADNDGIPNADETSEGNAEDVSTLAQQNEDLDDPDGDSIPNDLDLDSDGDGICDITEAGVIDDDRDCVVDDPTDTNENGLADIVEEELGGRPLRLMHTDNDGRPDFLDEDSDGDGICDVIEAGGVDEDGDCIHDDSEDLNGDGLADSLHPDTGTPLQFQDSYGDGIFDHLDKNSQGGGGCSIASVGTKYSFPVYCLVPVLIVIRRVLKSYRREINR